MSLVALIIILIVIGLLAWAFWTYVPVSQPFKGIVMFLIILLGCLLILNAAGLLGTLRI